MQIGLSIPWEVKVDYNIHRQYIDTSCENICADQTTCLTIFEIVIDSASICLLHFGMDVETRIT